MENRRLDDQLDHPALRLIAARPDVFFRQGHVAATYRRRGARTFGPYYALRYRDSDRLCSIYLGRAGQLVEKVRSALAALQQPLAQRRVFNRLERSIRASLRIEKLRLGSLLRPFGLRLKGFEVRGWRISPIRTLLPRRRRPIPRFSMRTSVPIRRRDFDPAARLRRFLEARDGYVCSAGNPNPNSNSLNTSELPNECC